MSIIIEHLNHKFVNYVGFIHRCNICGIQVWYTKAGWYFKEPEEIQYNRPLTLTCEQTQIKNILE